MSEPGSCFKLSDNPHIAGRPRRGKLDET